MSILIALQTLQQLSNSTNVLQKQDDVNSSLSIFHFHLAKTLNNLFNNSALLGVKFLGTKANQIPDDTTLKNLILKEIAELQKQIEFFSMMDNIQAVKTKVALIKIFDILTKIVSY